jgi:hypothetical protein
VGAGDHSGAHCGILTSVPLHHAAASAGVVVAWLFPITPIVTEVEKRHIIRTVLENLSLYFEANCLQLEGMMHLKVTSVSAGSGLAG